MFCKNTFQGSVSHYKRRTDEAIVTTFVIWSVALVFLLSFKFFTKYISSLDRHGCKLQHGWLAYNLMVGILVFTLHYSLL